MKAQVLSHSTAADSERLKLRTIFFAAVTLVLLFSIVYMRHLCIKTGYEISNLTEKIERTDIEYLTLLEKHSKAYDTENLYKKAKEIGLVLPDVNRTFYVK